MLNIKDILKDKKVFVFDFDGTMSDTAYFHLEVLNNFLKRYNVQITKEQFYKMVGFSHKELTEYLNRIYKLDLQYKDLLQGYLFNSMTLLEQKPLRCYPYVLDILKDYSEVDCVILSNQLNQTIEECLNLWGISNRISKIITTTINTIDKNNVYQNTFKYLGVQQNECVVFEDSQKYLTLAKQSNIATVGISHWINNGNIKADCIIQVPEHFW